MELYEKMRHFILEEKFKIELSNHYVDIVNYIKILKIDSKEMAIEVKGSIIRITGNNLAIQKMQDDEVLIAGSITRVDLGNNNDI